MSALVAYETPGHTMNSSQNTCMHTQSHAHKRGKMIINATMGNLTDIILASSGNLPVFPLTTCENSNENLLTRDEAAAKLKPLITNNRHFRPHQPFHFFLP